MKTNLEQFRNNKYTTLVFLDETTADTPCYIAAHPELPGCISQGDTPDEAIQNLREAQDLVIEHLLNNNLPVPIPQYLWSQEAEKKTVFQAGDRNALLALPQPMRGTIVEKPVFHTGNYPEIRDEYIAPGFIPA